MGSLEKVLQALDIGIFTANFLFNTSRVIKSIELSKECLILLNNIVLNKEQEIVRMAYIVVYSQMFDGYALLSNHTNAMECGRKLLALLHECGERNKEGTTTSKLAQLYLSQCNYKKAKELVHASTPHHDRNRRQERRNSMLRKPRKCVSFSRRICQG